MDRLDGSDSKPVSSSLLQAAMGDAESEVRDARIALLKADISNRLRRVCTHLTAEQFDELVRDIAEVTLRYEGRLHTPILPEPKRDD